jgi:hypothetical protein
MIPVILAAVLPGLFWEWGVETVDALHQAGIECVYVPRQKAAAWRKLAFCHVPMDASTLKNFNRVPNPEVRWQVDVASATRSPWIVANGWRFQRIGKRRTFYDARRGAAALAVAEAYAYGAEAILRIDPGDLTEFGRVLAFVKRAHRPRLPALANIAIVDDGSRLVGEVMNLMARRNLLFRAVPSPDPKYDLNIQLGSQKYRKAEAGDPEALTLKVRRELTDEKRLLRIYGSNVVLGHLTGDETRARLHLLNYGGKRIHGLRIRLRGSYTAPNLFLVGYGSVSAEDYTLGDAATEFTIPEMNLYAVVDLELVE